MPLFEGIMGVTGAMGLFAHVEEGLLRIGWV